MDVITAVRANTQVHPYTGPTSMLNVGSAVVKTRAGQVFDVHFFLLNLIKRFVFCLGEMIIAKECKNRINSQYRREFVAFSLQFIKP